MTIAGLLRAARAMIADPGRWTEDCRGKAAPPRPRTCCPQNDDHADWQGIAALGTAGVPQGWKHRAAHLSARTTTRWTDLVTV